MRARGNRNVTDYPELLAIERRADLGLGQPVVLESVGVRRRGLARSRLAVDLLDGGPGVRGPVEVERLVDAARDAERVGPQVGEGHVDELVRGVARPRVVE